MQPARHKNADGCSLFPVISLKNNSFLKNLVKSDISFSALEFPQTIYIQRENSAWRVVWILSAAHVSRLQIIW